MRTVKSLALAVLCGAAGTAFGQYSSPELMLVTDSGGTLANGTVVPARIERYDPYTGAYLGSFGTGYVTNPVGLAVVGQDAYVTDHFPVGATNYNRIDEFNFSTGAYDGSISAVAAHNLLGLAKYGSCLLASDFGVGGGNYGGVHTFDSSGNYVAFYAMPNGTYPFSIAADAGHDYVTTYSGGLFSYNLNASGVTTSLNWNVTPAATPLYGIAVNNGYVFTAGFSTITGDGKVLEYTAGGVPVGSYDSGTASSTYWSLAFGHNGMLYTLTSQDTIERFDGNVSIDYGPLGSFTLSETANPERIAVYAAPEPASMVGLALGALAMIARRRRK